MSICSNAFILEDMSRDWSTLQGRVIWCIENGLVKHAAGWSIASGLAKSYVGRVKNEGVTPSGDVLERMARVAGVPVRWLRFGEGEPMPEAVVELEDPYSSRAPVIAMARAEGAPPGAIAALRAEYHAEGDPGELHWRRRLREQIKEAKSVRKVLDDDDTFEA